MMTPAELDLALRVADERIEKLKVQYDMYFAGFERKLPLQPRRELDALVQALRREPVRATAVRFKVQSLIQKFSTYAQKWDRVLLQIEQGTFKRPQRASGSAGAPSNSGAGLPSRIIAKASYTLAPPESGDQDDDMDTLKPTANTG